MLKGDLTTTPLAPLLIQLAEESVTGCLHISDAEGDEALIYFKGGLVYAVSVPGRRPQLGSKLISSGDLAPEALADALEAQRTELQGWRLGELLVHLGYVDQPVVEAFVKEQVHDALWDLIRWSEGRWRFRKNEKTREDVAPPMQVSDLLADLRDRGADWEAISAIVHGPTAVPMLSASGGGAPETTLDADAWSMLCKIDGERSVAELARDCGYTLYEAGRVLVALVQAGLVDIEEDVDVSPVVPAQAAPPVDEELYGAGSVSSALAAAADPEPEMDGVPAQDALPSETDGDEFAALAALVSEVAAHVREEDANDSVAEAVRGVATRGFEPIEDTPSPVPLHPVVDEQSFANAVSRVSEALADVLGPAPDQHDPFVVPDELRIRRTPRTKDKQVERTPEMERRERLRAAAAAELAAAHALAESLRASAAAEQRDADVVDLDQVRRDAERVAAEEAERAAAEEAERQAAAAEEAERQATAAEEAERAAAEEAERQAAEEADRLAREEADRLAAEIAAAADEAWAEHHEREAAAAAAAEAERLAAEEAERAAAEEAERQAAEEAERQAAEEADRLAREQADRLAAEIAAAADEAWADYHEREAAAAAAEAERLAREEAERLAREEADRLAAEIGTAEEQAWAEYWQREAEATQRRAAEAAAEAERLAAEEAERAAAEQAERLAAEEAERAAAEQAERHAAEEAERLAAEEAERAAAEQAERHAAEEAERLAAEEAERAAAEAADVDEIEDEIEVPRLADPDPTADELARREVARAEMATATALLVELSTTNVDVPVQAVPVDEVDEAPEPEPEPVEAVPAAVGAPMEMADTAALLRELSSLGVEDEPAPAPAPAAAPRPPSHPARPSQPAPKKKRGLFGR